MTSPVPLDDEVCNLLGGLSHETVKAMAALIKTFKALKARARDGADLGEVETGIAESGRHCQRVFLQDIIEALDDKAPHIEHEGKRWRRVSTEPKTVITTLGTITYWRSRYRRRDERQYCPVDARLCLCAGAMTPPAARRGVHLVTKMTFREAARSFALGDGMKPSASTLRRVAKEMGVAWQEIEGEALPALRACEQIPLEAVSFSVMLDGVMLNLRGGKEEEDESGWREASCGAVSFYDARGEKLHTIRYGRMPESRKPGLKRLLAQECESIRRRRPDLELVVLADGAPDNWTFLDELGAAHGAVDFWHACQHLGAAKAHVHAPERWFKRRRQELLTDAKGVEKVIRALCHQRQRASTEAGREELTTVLGYFRKNRRRMQYARLREAVLPIGTGDVECTNKLLVTRRMKGCGMRWRAAVGQAVLSFGGLDLSGRFEAAWEYLMAKRRDWTTQTRPCEAAC